MHLSAPYTRKKTLTTTSSLTFGKPTRSPRTPTPSSLTYSYSDTFENVSQTQSVNYSDTFETYTKPDQTTIKTAKFTTIATEIEETAKDLTKISESFPTYSDTFETEYSSKDFESHPITEDSREQKSVYTESGSQYTTSEYTDDESSETRSFGTRTLESVAQSSTDRYSTEEFEDEEPYSYSESYEYSSTFEPDEELSSILTDPETIKREEEVRRVTEEAKENYISNMISNMRNRKFKDTDITELSVIEPVYSKPKIKDQETDNFSQRFLKRKMALLKHKKKHGYKPPEEKSWPVQRNVHVTEYGLDPQINEKLKIQNLISRMENAVNHDMHDPKKCKECSEYENKMDEEAARRHFIRMKTSKIQKDITEKQFEQHMIRMHPVNLIGELARSLPKPTTDPAIITEQLNRGLTLSKYL